MEFKWLKVVFAAIVALLTFAGQASVSLNCHSVQALSSEGALQSWQVQVRQKYQITDILAVSDPANLRKLVWQYRSLSPEFKQDLENEIGRVYGLIHDGKNQSEFANAKRNLDILITQIVNPYAVFLKAQKTGRSPQQAWNDILERTALLTGRPASFTSAQILGVLVNLQKHISRLDDDHYLVRETPFTVFGSWPNGRALRHQSDMDVFTENKNQQSFFEYLNSEINQQKLGLSEISPMATGTDGFLYVSASKTPIMIKVGPKRIELLVYPLLDQVEFPEDQTPQPLRYLLFTRQE